MMDPPDLTLADLREHVVSTGRVRLHVVEAGPPDGPLVVLLHGFPEFWYGWRHQVPTLARAGYRVVAPDLRGYNLSDKPRDLDAYRLDVLADDVVALIQALGGGSARAVIGHDWGGVLGWWLGLARPDCLERLAILNAPHPTVAWRSLRSNPAQWARSSYVLLFQLPGLPEWLLRRNRWRALERALFSVGRPDSFSAADLDRYREAWSRPGAITAMLNWYRAILRRPPPRPARAIVSAPLLLIWGTRDPVLGREMADASLAFGSDTRLETLEQASHWVQHDAPDQVNALLLQHLAG